MEDDYPKHVDTVIGAYATPHYSYTTETRKQAYRVGNLVIFPLCAWRRIDYYVFDITTYQVSRASRKLEHPDTVPMMSEIHDAPSYSDEEVTLELDEMSLPCGGKYAGRYPVEVIIVARPTHPGADWPERYASLHANALKKSFAYYQDVFETRFGPISGIDTVVRLDKTTLDVGTHTEL